MVSVRTWFASLEKIRRYRNFKYLWPGFCACLGECSARNIVCLSLMLGCLLGQPMIVFSTEHDFEVWTWEMFFIDLSPLGLPDETKLYLENANRFDRDASYMFQFHQRIGLQFKLPWFEGWSLMPVYQHVDFEPNANEDRYHFDLAYTAKKIFDSDWDFQFRFRWDIRDIHNRDSLSYRLRPMIQFAYPLPLKIQDRPIKTYLMNEINFDTYVEKLNRHRFGVGFHIPLQKNLCWTIGYQMENNRIRSGLWDTDSMLMTGVKFEF